MDLNECNIKRLCGFLLCGKRRRGRKSAVNPRTLLVVVQTQEFVHGIVLKFS